MYEQLDEIETLMAASLISDRNSPMSIESIGTSKVYLKRNEFLRI